jgi:Transcriptional activator of glycolytic enzymes
MWNEWYGEGRFADGLGGIEGRNKNRKAQWRKHLNPQHYSRTKIIIGAIAKYANNHQVPVREAIAVMNDWYVEPPVSFSVSKMKEACITHGLIKKGNKRGKHCKQSLKPMQDDVHMEEV